MAGRSRDRQGYGTAADRRKYTFEQLAAGTRFEFSMTVDNLEPEYEEVLKLIIKVLESGT